MPVREYLTVDHLGVGDPIVVDNLDGNLAVASNWPMRAFNFKPLHEGFPRVLDGDGDWVKAKDRGAFRRGKRARKIRRRRRRRRG